MDTQKLHEDELKILNELKGMEVKFDMGKIGAYSLKLESMLDVLMFNQAKILAKLEGSDADKIYEDMKKSELEITIDKYKRLSEVWK